MKYKYTWHVMHIIFTLLFPPWLVVWIICGLLNKQHNDRLDRS